MESHERLVRWLLDGDPAVAWQVRRDLLDEPVATVEAARARVATEGWGARLLAEQDPSGTWGDALYSPKCTSTTYTLQLLRQLGLPRGHPAAVAGCERLLDGARWFDGGLNLAKTVGYPETCITSIVVAVAASFGVVDERVEQAVAWLLGQQLADGGWNCDTVRRGSTHGSFDTTILALEALDEWNAAMGPDPVAAAAAGRGREFFLEHRLYCSHHTGEVVSRNYLRGAFPPGWHHDLVRGLDHFQHVEAPVDGRLAAAVEVLRSWRRGDGTWAGGARHPGRYWFVLEPARGPSRVATLRALRILRWWQAPVPGTNAVHEADPIDATTSTTGAGRTERIA
ncbi:MAG: hypothetical protein S0880_12895 [Actinomycetota bacterium]|nr:hypothetical protein [Actinomycetota bacterium]